MPLFYFYIMLYHKLSIVLFILSIVSCKKNDAIPNENRLTESISINDSISVQFIKTDPIINDSISWYFELEKSVNDEADAFLE